MREKLCLQALQIHSCLLLPDVPRLCLVSLWRASCSVALAGVSRGKETMDGSCTHIVGTLERRIAQLAVFVHKVAFVRTRGGVDAAGGLARLLALGGLDVFILFIGFGQVDILAIDGQVSAFTRGACAFVSTGRVAGSGTHERVGHEARCLRLVILVGGVVVAIVIFIVVLRLVDGHVGR